MTTAGSTITASSRNGMIFDRADRPSPKAPRSVSTNSERRMYDAPSRGPS